MVEQQKKDKKNLYNFDYESKEEKRLRQRKLKEKKLKEKELKQKEIKDKKIEERKKKKADVNKSASKKSRKLDTDKDNGQASQRKRYDDEIIIGVTRVPEKNNIKHKNKLENKDKANIIKRDSNSNIKAKTNAKSYNKTNIKMKDNKKVKNTKNNIDNSYIIDEQEPKNIKKKSTKVIKIIRLLALIVIIIAAVAFAMLSPIFNLKNIEIEGNSKITNDEIISLSGIKIDENIFKVHNLGVIKNIKQNAYIKDATIHKKLPGTLEIKIQERQPSYMLEYGNGYVYVDNQGYMLEISSIKMNLPILLGTFTSKESYKEGNRLNEEDLNKLGTVLKIMNVAQNNQISELITKINIQNTNNYTLYFETEGKIAYLGDCSNLETRMLYLVGILEREKSNPGEIFINMNLNTDDAYFRESV